MHLINNSKKKITPLSHISRKMRKHDIINRIKLGTFSKKRAIEKQEEKENCVEFYSHRKTISVVK
jgi:hypothetical protein